MAKNAKTAEKLHSSLTLAKYCSKFSKPGFNCTWTVSFQIFRLDSEKPEKSKIRLLTSAGSWKKQENARKTCSSALWTTPKAVTVWDHNKLWEILQVMGTPAHLSCLQRTLYAGRESTVRTGHGPKYSFQIGKGVCQGCILSPCFFNWYAEDIMRNAGLDEAQDGIKTGEKYQPPQIYKWHHPYGRKQRGIKEPLDDSEIAEWICWLKSQHSKKSDHGIWSHHFVAYKRGNSGKSDRLYPLELQNLCRWWLQLWN